MKNLITIFLIISSSLCGFAQKKAATKMQTASAVSTTITAPSNTNVSLNAADMYAALNSYAYEPKPAVVNNNANLSISYSAFVVGLDLQRIKSAANDYTIKLKSFGIDSKEIVELANTKYRYHNEFLPMDGGFNITFIRPDQNLNPKNVAIIPSGKISGNIKYRMSN